MDSHLNLAPLQFQPYIIKLNNIKNNNLSIEKFNEINAIIDSHPHLPNAYAIRGDTYELAASAIVKDPQAAEIVELKAYILSKYQEKFADAPLEQQKDENEAEYIAKHARYLALADYLKSLSINPRNEKVFLKRIKLLKAFKYEEELRDGKKHCEEALADTANFTEIYHCELITYLKPYFDFQLKKQPGMFLEQSLQEFFNTDPNKYHGELTQHSSQETRLGMAALIAHPDLAMFHFECALSYFKQDFIAATLINFLYYEKTNDLKKTYTFLTEIISLYNYSMAYIFRAEINDKLNQKQEAYQDVIHFLKTATNEHLVRIKATRTLDKKNKRFQNSIDIILRYANGIDEQSKPTNQLSIDEIKALINSNKSKKIEKAIIALKQYAKLNPDNHRIYFLLKEAYTKQKKPNEALLYTSLAIFTCDFLDPQRKKLIYARALLFLDLQQPLHSLNDFLQAATLFSEEKREELLDIYIELTKKRVEILVACNPQDPHLIMHYLDIVLTFRENPAYCRLKGDCYGQFGDYAQALHWYNASLNLDDNLVIRKKIATTEKEYKELAEKTKYSKTLLALIKSANENKHLITADIEPNKKVRLSNDTTESLPSSPISTSLSNKTSTSSIKTKPKQIKNLFNAKKAPPKVVNNTKESAEEQKKQREQALKNKLLNEQERKLREKQTADYFEEQKKQREQALKDKFLREQERKLREKETAKKKRLEKIQAKKNDDKHQIDSDNNLSTNEELPKAEQVNSNTNSILANLKKWERKPILQEEKELPFPFLEVEEEIFKRFENYIADKPHLADKDILLSGGSVVDRIRIQMKIEDLQAIETDSDYLTNLSCSDLAELFPEGHFNANVDGCFVLNKEITYKRMNKNQQEEIIHKNIKIDIFCLPDLKDEIILAHKDFFPFVVEKTGRIKELMVGALTNIKNGKLIPINPDTIFDNPIVILRTLYQKTKRNLEPPNNLYCKMKKHKSQLRNNSLASTEKVNYWINQLCSYRNAAENYKLLVKHEILNELFPQHVRELIINDSWLLLQMSKTDQTTTHPIIERIYASFVIAFVMQDIQDDVTKCDSEKYTYSNIYQRANEIIRSSNFFAAAFLKKHCSANPHKLPTEVKKYLSSAITSWLGYNKMQDLDQFEQPNLSSKAYFFLQKNSANQTQQRKLENQYASSTSYTR